ncbi:MAG: site-2 protease family protein [Candidatus Pacebacteria bacterium]|nr:site-2 protease family protein [Candidatus Paceibacterota bacterium]MBP9700804.1 site-2 protease family protein [Candidatus Paceibacterota bacterium]
MTIILFILVLLVTVLVHEWGHFIAAKKSGMLVEEFGFGIPPRLWSFKKGETKYSINALPIGGFVKIAGENGAENTVPYERQFESKPWYIKSIVLVAGVVCNFVLGLVLFTIAYTIGMPGMTPTGTPTVIGVVAGSPTEASGITVGDTIQSLSVGGVMLTTVDTDQVRTAIQTSDGPVTVAYTHDGVPRVATIEPAVSDTGRLMGIGIERIGIVKEPFFGAIATAWKQSVALTGNIFSAIGTLVGGLLTGHGSTAGLIGPVGLAKEVGNAATFGATYLLAFVATISLNLAVLNIMPFPALDGGRLLVVWGEALTRRKFSATTVGIIHTIGFLVLIGLMIVLTIGDIRRAL